MTNFERIQGMNVGEMAGFLTKEYEGICSCCIFEGIEKQKMKCYLVPGMCTQGVRRWLESEAKDTE